MSVQLDRWASQFGNEYTQRNVIDWRDRVGAWWTMLKGLGVSSVLEIGCNRGHNLEAIVALGPWDVGGIEPNAKARDEAWVWVDERIADVWPSIEERGYKRVDLVFTCGVLIHVPPSELDATLRKIHQLSRKYILCIEYFADQETSVEYRGFTDMLWKRNWPQEYESRFPLKLIRSGFWGKEAGFDDVSWWLWEKHGDPVY